MPAHAEKSLKQGYTLAHWSNALEIHGLSNLAEQLRVQPDPYASAAEKGLPVPPYLFFTSPNTFLNGPEGFIRKLQKQGVTNFFANFRPKEIGQDKYRQLNLNPDRLITTVKGKLRIFNPDQYNLLIAEYRPAIFGGTMIINPTGEFIMELVRGEMGDLAIGHENPRYTVNRSPDSGLFTFSESFRGEDPRLKDCVTDIIARRLVLPDSPQDTQIALREAKFKPEDAGYYEYSFLPARDGKAESDWDTVFFDYNGNPAFFLAEEKEPTVAETRAYLDTLEGNK